MITRWVRRLRDWVRAVLIAYLPQMVDRFPPVRLHLGPTVPGWVLRTVVAALALACVTTIQPQTYVWLLVAGLLAALILVPGRGLPATTAAVIGILLVITGTPPTIVRTALLLLGLHLMAQFGPLAGQVGFSGRIELRALIPPLRRLLAIQLVAQPIALLGAVLAGARIDAALLPVLAILGLAVLVLIWAPTLGPSRDP